MKKALLHKLAFLLILLFPASLVLAEFQRAENGMVSSRSDIASEVGKNILEQGGNAIDAAVAVGFALAVVYPSAGNIGGGGFMVIRTADGQVYTQDAREKAPLTASRDMFLDSDGELDRQLSRSSLQATGVPGSVAGLLDALERFGTMSREQVLAPAIQLAETGIVLNEDIAGQFQRNLRTFQQYPASLEVFSNNGEAYQAGDLWQQPDLAATLTLISAFGRDGFYKGPVADMLVTSMQANNGLISHSDLESYEPVWREPVHGVYRGYDIWSMPAPSSGGVLLVQMLNMLEAYNLTEIGWGSAETVHLMVEAQRRAYADRAEYLGDPDFYNVPSAMLTSKLYARQRFADFDPEAASLSDDIGAGSWPQESTQTTHYSIIDTEGNAVAVTTTLNSTYGNKFVVPGAGFLLNNEMDDFSSKPNTANGSGLLGGVANEIQPSKRMLSSMTPTIVTQNDNVFLVTGSPGGSTIINTVLQVVINTIDHHMNVEDAVNSPRFHHQWQPDIIRYEADAITDQTVAELRAMGHQGISRSRFPLGDANSIMLIDNVLEGVSDPRNVGGVAGF
ncbi:gamma-glutamyltransferase [Haliea sp. AH-315-K21]|uniref:Glutathione hydrolase proenzyme n=1 Tax=SAR86 cluster bacterium TaxID=2030880 RepID=A0A2A5CEE6_9GAMM|nr:gamma-glutamyltransferase [Haliea sp. AH-315-K21]MBN4075864.1 gamma-glutamyltransferase [Gammaproteobacteria bacterium AH-315-E17]PCJ42103.1 MAG: gamma-glutamyltransferase [SAR86 cluster bacterium]